jgi:tetratricopeptide (TPR) repeat protein
MDYTKPAEQFLYSLLVKSGPTAGNSAFLLGQIYKGRLDYSQALKFYRKAYLLGPKNRDYIEANAHIAFLLENYDEVEGLLKREIDFLKGSRRKFPGKIYNAIKNLAHIYEGWGNIEAALALHQEALDGAHKYIKRAPKIYQTAFGLEHPKVAASLSNLAAIYQKQN